MDVPTSGRRLGATLGAALGATLGAVAVLLGGSACDRAAEQAPPPLDVDLTLTVTPESGSRRIDYTLVNHTAGDIVVFSGVPARDTHENPVADPNATYVTARDDHTAEIAKRIFAPPEGVGLAVDFVVRGVVVAPAQSIGETVRIPLPLRARHPYDTAARLPEPVTRAVFCVGVAERDRVPPIPTSSGDADDPPTFPHRASVADAQQLVCGKPFELGA